MRADAMLEAGDLDGYAVWKRILRTVGELQGAEPGARVHLPPPVRLSAVVPSAAQARDALHDPAALHGRARCACDIREIAIYHTPSWWLRRVP